MKSYDEHLKSLLSRKPSNQCHRSSALFPIFLYATCSMRLLFLNYWKLKRNIDHLLCRLYFRSTTGETLVKKCFYVDEIKGYEVSLSSLVSRRFPVGGSLEIEFASPENLVFPFPAVVVHYQGPYFSTFVHAAQRSFNDEEDEKVNERLLSVESGFNIYSNSKTYPFLTFVNGKDEFKNKTILLAAYNLNQQVLGSQITLSSKPYATTYMHLKNWKELQNHLGQNPGCLKISLPSKGVFPRLIVGNRNTETSSMSVTHTYYDLVQKKENSDFWRAPNSSWQAASLMLPLFSRAHYNTQVYFYPIYSPASFNLSGEIYTLGGKKLKTLGEMYSSPKSPLFHPIYLSDLAKDLDLQKPLLFKLIAQPDESGYIPSRLKIGYDVGFKRGGLPCNICTNFYPANSHLDQKPKTFKWAPFMSKNLGGEVWCINDAPKKEYTRNARVTLTFYRNSDTCSLTRRITIPPHGAYRVQYDSEVEFFMKNETGWCTFESDNPYITTYSFSLMASGNVGGDHGF